MPHPPAQTNWNDFITLFKYSLIAAAAIFLIRGWLWQWIGEVKTSTPSEGATAENEAAEAAVRKFNRSLGSFPLDWVPLLIFFLGGIGVSLYRDAGYLIVPWPLAIQFALSGGIYGYSRQCRHRIVQGIRKLNSPSFHS